MGTSLRYVCVLRGLHAVDSVVPTSPHRHRVPSQLTNRTRTRLALRAALTVMLSLHGGTHHITLGGRAGYSCERAPRPRLHARTACQTHCPTKEKVQYPFLYKNILFKRQFKNKNSVQHHEFLFFFVSMNKMVLRKRGHGVPGGQDQLSLRGGVSVGWPGPERGEHTAAALASFRHRLLGRKWLQVCFVLATVHTSQGYTQTMFGKRGHRTYC